MFKIYFNQVIVDFRHSLHQFRMAELHFILNLRRRFPRLSTPLTILVVGEVMIVDKIYDPRKILPGGIGKLEKNRVFVKFRFNGFQDGGNICPFMIQLIQENNSGKVQLIGPLPYFFSIKLYPFIGTDYKNQTIDYPETGRRISNKVTASRCINEV